MILVAGATGYTGGMIVRRLLEQGRQVRILVRPQSDYAGLVAAGAELALGDLKDHASLDAACAGVSVVITTANAIHGSGDDNIETVDRLGNRNLVDAASAAGAAQFIFLSALGSTPDSPVPLFQAKAATEAHLRTSGMAYTILAPNAFMDFWVAMVVGGPLREGHPVTLVAPAERRHTFVAAADVAAYAVACIGHPAAQDRYIPIGGPAALSWRDVVMAFERVQGSAIPVELVAPGDPMPGIPEQVLPLLIGMELYDSPVEMSEVARVFGVTPTSIETFAGQLLGKAMAH
jgi:NADH dehydrogenase